MNGRTVAIVLICAVLGITGSSGFAASPPRMRPYVGIGVVVFPEPGNSQKQDLQLQLYEEPGLVRLRLLTSSALPGNEWVFGSSGENAPLIVSTRKGDWLRVFFDDAGREAWINPQHKGHFQSWEQYLKLHTGRMLPALQPQFYQLLQQPGGKLVTTLTPKQMFRVLKLENLSALVLTDNGKIGWVRWRDDDGRLTVGTGEIKKAKE